MAQPILDLPADFGAWTLAEWIETAMLLEPQSDVSRTSLLRTFASGNEPDSSELDELFAEIRRRANVAPRTYPFRVTEDGLITLDSGVDRRVYEFLVLLSSTGVADPLEEIPDEVAAAFALLVREAAKGIYLNGEAVRFQAPGVDNRPETLAEAIVWLAELTGAPVGDLSKLSGAGTDPGFDVVAWRPFADRAGLADRLLVQATVDKDLRREAGALSPEDWQEIFGFATTPRLALAVPSAIEPQSTEAQDLLERVDVLLDRLRLCELLDASALAVYGPEWKAMREWIECRRAEKAESEPTPTDEQSERRINPFRRPTQEGGPERPRRALPQDD